MSERSRTRNLDHLEEQVSEVTHLLKNDVEKVVERGDKINQLDERAESLQESSIQFKRNSIKLKRKMCCLNFKMTCILIAVIMTIIGIIVVVILVEVKPWENGDKHGNSTVHLSLPSNKSHT